MSKTVKDARKKTQGKEASEFVIEKNRKRKCLESKFSNKPLKVGSQTENTVKVGNRTLHKKDVAIVELKIRDLFQHKMTEFVSRKSTAQQRRKTTRRPLTPNDTASPTVETEASKNATTGKTNLQNRDNSTENAGMNSELFNLGSNSDFLINAKEIKTSPQAESTGEEISRPREITPEFTVRKSARISNAPRTQIYRAMKY